MQEQAITPIQQVVNGLQRISKSATTLKARPLISSLALIDRQRIDELISRYGDKFYPDVCSAFPTKNREQLYPTLDKAIRAEAPSLQELDRTWSDEIKLSVVWLKFQLSEVFAYVGLRDKVSEEQKTTLAKNLRSMCVDSHMAVSMSELMVFFTRFEQGKYERFYGYEHANPQVVTASFSTFLDELYERRNEVLKQMRQEEELRQREEWAKNAVPMPESSKRKLAELMGDITSRDKYEPKSPADLAEYKLRQIKQLREKYE